MTHDSDRRSRIETLEERWIDKQEGRNALPLLRHLALRCRPMAMTELARIAAPAGLLATPFSAAGLARRAWKLGYPVAAYNLAMQAFNDRRMAAYRSWLSRAPHAGDADARAQLHRFEIRLPHETARKIGRGRPWKAYD